MLHTSNMHCESCATKVVRPRGSSIRCAPHSAGCCPSRSGYFAGDACCPRHRTGGRLHNADRDFCRRRGAPEAERPPTSHGRSGLFAIAHGSLANSYTNFRHPRAPAYAARLVQNRAYMRIDYRSSSSAMACLQHVIRIFVLRFRHLVLVNEQTQIGLLGR